MLFSIVSFINWTNINKQILLSVEEDLEVAMSWLLTLKLERQTILSLSLLSAEK